MSKPFPPTILLAAVLALLAGLTGFVTAQGIYQEFPLTEYTYWGDVQAFQSYTGDIPVGKALCDTIPNCIGVLGTQNLGLLLRYSAGRGVGVPAIYQINWRYDATEGPSCSSSTDQFVDIQGNCQCASDQVQNTRFGCTVPTPSGSFNRRSRQLARTRVQMPGRPLQPQY